MRSIPLFELLLCIALTACVACSNEPVQEEAEPASPLVERTIPEDLTLALIPPQTPTETPSVEVYFQHQLGTQAPRAAEIFLRVSDNLKLNSNIALEATQGANKELVVQEPEPGLLRVILYATSNLTPLETGGLVRLNFTRTAPGEASVAFAPGQVNLAPSEATQGMSLGQPFVVEAHP